MLRDVIATAGADTIHDVWPHLEVFFHGGISFEPYREQYRSITDPAKMKYMETYNASEGFFAVQDEPDSTRAMLLTDCGIFYEFQPVDAPDAPPVTCRDVEPGRVYALIISSCSGLWRYPIGDTVRVESVCPLRITIAGRTKSFINAFGEELMVHNADAAIAATCRELGCAVADYTAAPVFADCRTQGHHQWLVEFSCPPESTGRLPPSSTVISVTRTPTMLPSVLATFFWHHWNCVPYPPARSRPIWHPQASSADGAKCRA